MTTSNTRKLLILNGSPIRGSSTDVVSEAIAEEMELRGWEWEAVYLNDYNITPCQSCGVRDDDDICIYHDEIYPVYEKFNESDVVVAASPVYFDTISAQMKLFIDRCNCYRPLRESPSGELYLEKREWKERRGIIVLVGGSRQKFDCALTVIKGFFKWTGVEFVDSFVYSHNEYLKGAASRDESALRSAKSLSEKL